MAELEVSLILLLWVYSRDERSYVFQIKIQSKNHISKCSPNPKSRYIFNQNPSTGIGLGPYGIQLKYSNTKK